MKPSAQKQNTTLKNGPSAAAILAAGIGLAVTGLVTVTAENIPAWLNALAWSKPVGALAGKTTLGLIGWIVSWVILGVIWKDKEVDLRPVLLLTIVLAVVGLLTTFPPFFDLFSKH
ncbi:MAG: hypothetical protein ABSG21_03095 [Spirochaetia bacterium]|jgi:hypothetical protein